MKLRSACQILAMASASLLLSTPAADAGETYYKWTDERGRPVHSDRPPPQGIDYEVIRSGTGLRRAVDASEGAVPLEVEPTESNPFEPVTISRVKIEKNPEYCARARENLEVIEGQARIRMRDEQGEIYYLTEEDREYQRQRALETIKVHCE